jgi:hypothetical protein
MNSQGNLHKITAKQAIVALHKTLILAMIGNGFRHVVSCVKILPGAEFLVA